jgi:hypothetical protein
MSFPLINPTPTFLDGSGNPLVSGTIEFRDPTSNALIKSYPTADDADAQTNENANPLTLNSRGEAANGLYLEDGVKYKVILKDSAGATVWTQDDVRCPQYTAPITNHTISMPLGLLGLAGQLSGRLVTVQAYTRNAAIVEDRTLLASASATTLNNNNVLAALIADLQQKGVIS